MRLPWSVLALVILAAILVWATLGVAALTVCLNETPMLADGIGEALPISASAARTLLPWFAPFGIERSNGLACETAAPARAMAVAGLAYLAAMGVLDRWAMPPRARWTVVALATAVMQLAMFFMPALLSSDILDYASHGRVASVHGANPYLVTPSAFPTDSFSGMGAWPDVGTVYGPLWTRIDATVTGLFADGTSVQVALAYKAIAFASELISAFLMVWVVRHWTRLGITDGLPEVAVAMWLWNPLVNVELVGNAHNEAVMILFVLLAFALMTLGVRTPGQAWLWPAALVCLWLGALIKFVPAGIEAIASLVWLRRALTLSQRLRRGLLLLATFATISVVVAWPWLDSPAVAVPLAGLAAGGQRFKDAWQDAVAAYVTVRVVPRLGVPDDPATSPMDLARTMVWGVTRALFAGYVALEAWLLWKRANADAASLLLGVASASIRALLLAVLLYVSQVYPWYFLWALPVACLLGFRNAWGRAVVVFGLTFLPAYYLREFESYGVFYLPIYAVAGLAILAAISIWRRVPRLRLQY